jgi:membrane protease YdiL (CAAX protease family)
MAQSARYAWWLLIALFGFLILFNNLIFLTLFFRRESPGLTEQQVRYELDSQLRYALFMSNLKWLRDGLKPAVERMADSIRKELYGTEAEWEARLYVALMERLGGLGSAHATLKGLSEAPSRRLLPHERRWYASLWCDALEGQLQPQQVPLLRDALSPAAPPLALRLAESLMWQQAGDARRAQAILTELQQDSQLRWTVLGVGACCGLLCAIAGVGLLLWYLVQQPPLTARPLPDASPFILDPTLWALVLFLIVMLNGEIATETLKLERWLDAEWASIVIYLIAGLISFLFLWWWSQEGNNPAGVLRFRGSVWYQLGAALMGFGIYLPIMLLSLFVTIWLSPALPSEQTHPLAERSFDEMGFGMALWMVLLAVVFAPVVEEVLFRGVLFQVLWQRTGRVWLSALVSGFLFGIIHPQFLGGILSVTLLGITLAMVYAHTRSLLPCIVIHALNNAMATLVLWVFSG